ncbi:MAG: hypothetical protein LHV69_07580 [Elusimicrobia bacterium]|nr:hypothetical protein [Candidatus Obscuribacterium magneticum]
MNTERFFHLLNPSVRHRQAVKKFFLQKPDESFTWIERESHPTHLETVVEWALWEGRPRIALWGGDGTFSRVAQFLYKAKAFDKISLALIPVGTANDFSRKAGFMNWEKVAEALLAWNIREMKFDVGLLQAGPVDRVFVNNAGFGRTAAALKKKVSNPWQDILNFKAHRIQLEWGEGGLTQYQTFRAALGIICNSPYFNRGLFFREDVSPADGLLNAFFMPVRSRCGYFIKFIQGRMGKSLRDETTLTLQARFLNVHSDDDLYPQVDGEPVLETGVRELRTSVLRNAMNLLVPQGN